MEISCEAQCPDCGKPFDLKGDYSQKEWSKEMCPHCEKQIKVMPRRKAGDDVIDLGP